MNNVTGRHTSQLVLVAGAVSVAAFLAAPTGTLGQAAFWFVPALLAAGLVTARARVEKASPLWILATGQFIYVGVSIVWFMGSAGVGFQRTFPSPVDAGYFVVYGTYAAFLLVVLRGSFAARRVERRIALMDSLVLTTSVAAVLWIVAVRPELANGTSTWTTTVAVLYPASCLLLSGLASCLTLTAGRRQVPVLVPVWLWLGATTLGGVAYAVQSTAGEFDHGEPVMVVWMVSNTALGAFAVHPRLVGILPGRPGTPTDSVRPAESGPGSRVRLGFMFVAALTPLALSYSHSDETTARVLLLISAVTFGVITYRTALLAGDLDEKNLLTEQLDQAVARYAAIINSTDDAIITVAASGEILDWNRGAERMFWYTREEAVGRNISLIVKDNSNDFTATIEQIRQGRSTAFEVERVRKDGRLLQASVTASAILDDNGEVTAVVGILRDISERKAREAQLHQDSKLESLGRLSAGLAHEINTPIQFVGDNARFLAEAYQDLIGAVLFYRGLLDSSEPLSWQERMEQMRAAEASIEFDYLQREIPSAVEQTLEGIERVSTIVRAMKTFSHPGNSEQVPADLNEALVATLTVARYQVKNVAELEMELGDLPPVVCNIADLNQVFLNLVVNAADAIEETGRRGGITVSTAVEDAQAVIRITDTGGGIPDEVLPKIFDPFFTTKDVGRGTGQGLPLVRALVQEGHGGVLAVESTAGVGSTFTIRLPIKGRAKKTAVEELDAVGVPA